MTLVKTKKKKKETNPNYGGQRPGAGRKSPFAEKTTTGFFTFPESKLEIVNQIMIPLIESWKIKPDPKVASQPVFKIALEGGGTIHAPLTDLLIGDIESKKRFKEILYPNEQFAKDGEGIKAEVDKVIYNGEIANISPIDRESAIKLIEDVLEDMPLLPENGVFIGRTQQPSVVIYDSEDEKGVEVNFPKEDAPLTDVEPIETPPFVPLPQEEADKLIKEAESKYRSGKIVRDVLSNEEYRLGFGLDFDFTRNAVVMGGKSLTGGVYSKVILFINGEWAKS